jgi:hypothetical protein
MIFRRPYPRRASNAATPRVEIALRCVWIHGSGFAAASGRNRARVSSMYSGQYSYSHRTSSANTVDSRTIVLVAR